MQLHDIVLDVVNLLLVCAVLLVDLLVDLLGGINAVILSVKSATVFLRSAPSSEADNLVSFFLNQLLMELGLMQPWV